MLRRGERRWRPAWPVNAISVFVAAGTVLTSAVASGELASARAVSQQQPPAPPTLTWGSCEAGVDEAFDCATLTVPLDYNDLAGPTLDVALIRLPAEDGRREGAILLNPGGPGDSGYDFAANAASAINTEFELDGRFDIIGFDPRGVDRSGGIRCLSDAEIDDMLYLDGTPEDAEEQAALEAADATWVLGCRSRFGDTLHHYSTANTARDMEWIRWGLGDEQISFIGISYGTYLGAVYATMFPDQVRAMVLDSAFEPSGDSVLDQYATQLVGFERAFNNWAAWCQADIECSFAAADVGARWDALLETLEVAPLLEPDWRVVNEEVMEDATLSAMYDELMWPTLGAALADAEAGDGSALLAMADEYNDRDDDGVYSSLPDSSYVISCASGFEFGYPDDPEALLAQLKAAAPRFAASITVHDLADDGAGCADVVTVPATAVVPSYQGAGPVLVVGGRNDPATPYRWALELVSAMGPTSALLTYSGQGHGYLLVASCVDDAEAALIRDLTLPPPGTVCDPDPQIPRPVFWDSIPVPSGVGPGVSNPAIASSLGLSPSSGYSEMWYLSGDAALVEQAYVDAFEALGFEIFETFREDGAPVVIPVNAPDGQWVDIFLFTPELLASNSELSGVADVVPDGFGLVLIRAYDEYGYQ